LVARRAPPYPQGAGGRPLAKLRGVCSLHGSITSAALPAPPPVRRGLDSILVDREDRSIPARSIRASIGENFSRLRVCNERDKARSLERFFVIFVKLARSRSAK